MNTKCPCCNYLATEHETLGNQKNPRKEDISFCINCGEVSQYSGNNLIKIKVDSLDRSLQRQIRDIQTAWLRQKEIRKVNQRGTNNAP